jgi:hypothetical protein
MATTLPSWTRKIDDLFLETWYDMKPDAIDNILDANVIWAALRDAGCMETQEGGDLITETIRYGTSQATVDVGKGDTLSMGEPDLETMARWSFRNKSTHIQRSAFQDRENRGKYRLRDYVGKRLKAARERMVADYEDAITAVWDATHDSTSKAMQSINCMVPLIAYSIHATVNTAGYTYGTIARPTANAADSSTGVYSPSTGNTWWGSKYLPLTLPVEVNLVSNMKTLYNAITNNQESPNLIISDQGLWEAYEDYALDASQLVKDADTKLADLGYEVMRFKGKPWVWSNKMLVDPTGTPKNQMLMLNTKWVHLTYDPGMWFDMSEWKPLPLQTERITHILSTCNLWTNQPRRHGRLYLA